MCHVPFHICDLFFFLKKSGRAFVSLPSKMIDNFSDCKLLEKKLSICFLRFDFNLQS